ncbi:hypothetical protein ACQPYE_17110 [Actinosynnema sp. CA-299493]
MKIDWSRVDDANQYQQGSGPEGNGYQGDEPDLHLRVPPPPRREAGGGIVVSPDVLRTFAANLRELKGLLTESIEKLREISVAPGAFFDAVQLGSKVDGDADAGIVASVEQFVLRAIDALEVTALNLEQLAHDYDSTEELNGLTAEKLNEHLQDATKYISDATGLKITPGTDGNFDMTPWGGGNGEGDGGKGDDKGDDKD